MANSFLEGTRRIFEMKAQVSETFPASPENGNHPLRLTAQELDRFPIQAHAEFDTPSGNAAQRVLLLSSSKDSVTVMVEPSYRTECVRSRVFRE